MNQKVQIRHEDDHNQSHQSTFLANGEWTNLGDVPSMFGEDMCPPSAIKVDVLSQAEIRQITQMARVCPITFAKALASALSAGPDPAPTFVPKTNPSRAALD